MTENNKKMGDTGEFKREKKKLKAEEKEREKEKKAEFFTLVAQQLSGKLELDSLSDEEAAKYAPILRLEFNPKKREQFALDLKTAHAQWMKQELDKSDRSQPKKVVSDLVAQCKDNPKYAEAEFAAYLSDKEFIEYLSSPEFADYVKSQKPKNSKVQKKSFSQQELEALRAEIKAVQKRLGPVEEDYQALRTLLGKENFEKAVQSYLESPDGQEFLGKYTDHLRDEVRGYVKDDVKNEVQTVFKRFVKGLYGDRGSD